MKNVRLFVSPRGPHGPVARIDTPEHLATANSLPTALLGLLDPRAWMLLLFVLPTWCDLVSRNDRSHTIGVRSSCVPSFESQPLVPLGRRSLGKIRLDLSSSSASQVLDVQHLLQLFSLSNPSEDMPLRVGFGSIRHKCS